MKTIAYIRSGSMYNDPRATKEIKTLANNGYNVLVFGWDRDGQAVEKCLQVFDEKNVHLSFYRCKTGALGIKGIFKLIGFLCWVYQSLRSKKKYIDVVHMCDMDAGVGSALFCWKYNIPYVYDIFDYYVDTHNVPSFLRDLVEKLDIKIINRADTVIICMETRMEQISKAKPLKVVVIHNAPEVSNEKPMDVKYDYSYCGGLDGQRLIEEIVTEYSGNSALKVKFAGNGRIADKVRDCDAKYENFEYVGTVTHAEALEISAESRVLSAIYEPVIRNNRLCAPNKFYEALALGKPIIVCRGTGIDRIVEENKIGIVIDYDAKQFFDVLKYFKYNPDVCNEMGKRGRKLFEERYDWRIMKKRLLDIYNCLSGRKIE